jgi:hypothetical protein
MTKKIEIILEKRTAMNKSTDYIMTTVHLQKIAEDIQHHLGNIYL